LKTKPSTSGIGREGRRSDKVFAEQPSPLEWSKAKHWVGIRGCLRLLVVVFAVVGAQMAGCYGVYWKSDAAI